MSDTFDPSTIAEGVFRRLDIGVAAKFNRRLIDCEHHHEMLMVFDKLEGVPSRKNLRPSEELGPTTVCVYGKDGAKNQSRDEALAAGSTFTFPDGVTVTKLRTAPLTYRLDDANGRQLLIRRRRESRSDQWHWEVTGKSGFDAPSGRRAGARHMGRGPARSFD